MVTNTGESRRLGLMKNGDAKWVETKLKAFRAKPPHKKCAHSETGNELECKE